MGRVYPSVVALYFGIRTRRASSWVLLCQHLFCILALLKFVLQIFASVEEAFSHERDVREEA